MISSNIAKRYAKAFFGIAGEERKYEPYYKELRQFSSLLEMNKNLREFLDNPIFDQADKKAVVTSLLARTDISPVTANFLKLLVDKRRINVLPEIEDCYRELMDAVLKNVRVQVKTAFPLSPQMVQSLQSGLESMTGKHVEMAVMDDPSLVGGIVVRVGDTIYDDSIRTQLNKIRNLLGEEI